MSARLLWTPSKETATQTNLARYQAWLLTQYGLHFASYEELWRWSVDDLDTFWETIFTYFDIQYSGEVRRPIRTGDDMLHTRWFEGVELNYAEHIFRAAQPEIPAILHAEENVEVRAVSWEELRHGTAAVQRFLEQAGVGVGDRVAGYLPCTPEATMAFLATSGLGAVWSSCAPEFGVEAVIDRFAQIEPKALIAAAGYGYGGKWFDRTDAIAAIVKVMPSVKAILILSGGAQPIPRLPLSYASWRETMEGPAGNLRFVRSGFNHPIWILYSSGTTGLPKAIVHSQGGVLLEQLKYHHLHHDIRPGERFFWYTTTGWMMWNHLHGSLLCGAAMATYNGNPAYPDLMTLWRLAAQMRINHLGTSASHLLASQKAGLAPGKTFDLSPLREIGSTGSALPAEGFEWVYAQTKPDVWLASMSGGTDVCTAFVGGAPILPVYEGEIQCIALGCALSVWDEAGRPTERGAPGEMVITKPMPSMPIYLWNDPRQAHYSESYFGLYPGIWRHGDWATITDHGGVKIYGRSDATLNRNGVRIGAGEIYRALEKVEEVTDGLVVCIEEEWRFFMPLFVALRAGATLSDALHHKIHRAIVSACSPRHAPDAIIQAPDIPYTISGKKVEMPVKKILMGQSPLRVLSAGALRNPESIDFYVQFYRQHLKKIILP